MLVVIPDFAIAVVADVHCKPRHAAQQPHKRTRTEAHIDGTVANKPWLSPRQVRFPTHRHRHTPTPLIVSLASDAWQLERGQSDYPPGCLTHAQMTAHHTKPPASLPCSGMWCAHLFRVQGQPEELTCSSDTEACLPSSSLAQTCRA